MPKPGKGKALPEERTDELLAGYVQAAPEAYLDQIFGKWDQIRDTEQRGSQRPYLDRADHILINGRSVTEILVERFNKEFPNMKNESGGQHGSYEREEVFRHFLIDQVDKKADPGATQLVKDITAKALANGDKVEVFVPDPVTGQIKNQPMRLNCTGYWPANPVAKPAQLSRWKRFWGKFGFYKQEVEQYRQATESYDAQQKPFQKVRFCNKAARAALATNLALMPNYVKEMFEHYPQLRADMDQNYPKAKGNPAALGEANGFRTNRASVVCTAMLVLATKRDPKTNQLLYTNDQLFDMENTEMQAARAEAMKETYDQYKKGDTAWLVKVQREACQVLPERIDNQAKTLDFSRADLVDQKGYRTFALLNDTAYDLSQDVSVTIKDQKERTQISRKISDCSQWCRRWGKSLMFQKNIVNGITGPSENGLCNDFPEVFLAQAGQKAVAKGMRDGKTFNEVTAGTMFDQISRMTNTMYYDDDQVNEYKATGKGISAVMAQSLMLANEAIQNPEKFNREIMNGVLETRFKLKKVNLDPNAEVPVTFEITSSATAERKIERQQARTRAGGDIGIGLGG